MIASAPGLVDEWLQARNALSIEIFCRTPFIRHPPPSAAPEGFANCVIRGTRATRKPSCVTRPSWMRRNHRHPTLDAEEVHGDQVRAVAP